mmetsp:Transcript_89924/g.155718  ORF Transcript_89924/g.155718 Transcript_89924/m.155718 type:complete len:370 (-) Transcript_89924:28-1137(-)
MRRRIDALGASTSASKKKRSWRDDDKDDVTAAKPDAGLEQDLEDELLAAEELASKDSDKPKAPEAAAAPGQCNAVVWMDIAVAGKPRGRMYFELFRDLAPKAAENFRQLCVGVDRSGKQVSYTGTEFDAVTPGRSAEGGDIIESLDIPAIERPGKLLHHTKSGLLTMESGSPSFGSPQFSLTFAPMPEWDTKHVVVGQLLGPEESKGKLHPLHWVEAVGTTSGTPREAAVVAACGECGTAETEALLGAAVMAFQIDRTPETQEDRYGRAGLVHGRLSDAITAESMEEVLELVDDVLEWIAWEAKKAKKATEKDRKAQDLETSLKHLRGVLEDVEHRSLEVHGPDGKPGRLAKSHLYRVRDLEQALNRLF